MQVPNHTTGINLQDKRPEEVCRGCMLGHQQKKIGHASMSKATELFQLIHTNFGDPYCKALRLLTTDDSRDQAVLTPA